YLEILEELRVHGAEWVQFDEPFLVMDLDEQAKEAFSVVYEKIRKSFPSLKILLATYFDGLKDNLATAASLPVNALHVDLVRYPQQLDEVLNSLPQHEMISLGIVDGRNIWKDDLEQSLAIIREAIDKLGEERILLAPSCS